MCAYKCLINPSYTLYRRTEKINTTTKLKRNTRYLDKVVYSFKVGQVVVL